MSAPTPIAITYGMLIVAIGAVAALAAMVFVLKPQGRIESTPPPAEAVPEEPKPAPKASAGTMSFRDPENTKRYFALQAELASFRKKLATVPDSKAMPEDDLDAACAAIAGLANPLAGEPHPNVQKIGDDAKHACDYERPLTTIRLAVKLLKAPGAAKKSICNAAGRSTSVLVEKKYVDDEQVKLQLAELGKACM